MDSHDAKGDGIRLSELLSIPSFNSDYYWPDIPLLLVLGDEAGFAETGIIRPPGASCSSTGVLDVGAEVNDCPISLDALVVPICSKQEVSQTLPISLGRSLGMDVCLNHMSISKCHAQFLPPSEDYGPWKIRDTGSLNGTWVEGIRLHADEAYRARGFSDMTFGTLHCRFLMPGSMTALVHMIADANPGKSAADTDPDVYPEDEPETVPADDPRRTEDTHFDIQTWVRRHLP